MAAATHGCSSSSAYMATQAIVQSGAQATFKDQLHIKFNHKSIPSS